MRLSDSKILENFTHALSLTPEKSKIVVMGLGATGLSVIRFLTHYHFDLTALDSRISPEKAAQFTVDYPKITLRTGAFDSMQLEGITHVIASPGITLEQPLIKSLQKAHAKIISDIDLFALATQTPIIAITGSNGKSTVTTLLGQMATAAATNTAIGGNLGTAALDLLDSTIALYVLELSSFQLERTSQLNAAAATVLNISDDHLDRHKTLDNYCAEKEKVFNGTGAMILNADDNIVQKMHRINRKSYYFSVIQSTEFHIASTKKGNYFAYRQQNLMPCGDFPLKGQHNQANALSALALGHAVGLNLAKMCEGLKTFSGLAHRMQFVVKIKGVTWINDSKATNIGACIAALKGYNHKIILLAGGEAKGADMSRLKTSVQQSVNTIILMGKDAHLIATALENCIPIHYEKTMKEAVITANKIAVKGETVLLSPACASLDQYQNYQQRGEAFISAVTALEKP
jgi:UDP-N-acetylmuramoylalanine--D-glutamate ligase